MFSNILAYSHMINAMRPEIDTQQEQLSKKRKDSARNAACPVPTGRLSSLLEHVQCRWTACLLILILTMWGVGGGWGECTECTSDMVSKKAVRR